MNLRLPWQRLMGFRVERFVAPPASAAAATSATFESQQVRVLLSSQANRCVHPEPETELSINRIWSQALDKSPRLFNGSKFRLQQWTLQNNMLQMRWGLTDYKTYLGTCCSTRLPQWLQDAAGHGRSDQFAYLSRKVGVAAVLETADDQIAFIRRSETVGIYPNMFDTPGGHPEPSHIGLSMETLTELERPGQEERKSAMETAAVNEFFQSILTEVHEELNVTPSDLSTSPLLLGVVYQGEACTPSFTFFLKSLRSAEELRALYAAGPADQFESSRLEFIGRQTLLQQTGTCAFGGDQFTPSAQGSISLWRDFATAV